jgi:D-alanine-D-alanine ligase
MHLAPSLLDAIHIPYTGSPAAAIFLTTHKLLAKERLRHAGIPTPEAFILGKTLAPLGCLGTPCPSGQAHNFGHAVSYILKTVWEHASFGLDDSAVVQPKDAADLEERLRERTALMGRECFAERYVDGREFNLSLLEGTEGPQVLPPAEIDFTGFPTDRPRIVGYKAKWEAESAEYVLTPRSFDFPATDSPLLDRLGAMARACWHAFGLKGYARVDFRVDPDGEPWVLEINANPCLSPDAGFAAALSRSGIPYDAAIGRILDAACTMAGAAPGQPLPGTSPHVPTS